MQPVSNSKYSDYNSLSLPNSNENAEFKVQLDYVRALKKDLESKVVVSKRIMETTIAMQKKAE